MQKFILFILIACVFTILFTSTNHLQENRLNQEVNYNEEAYRQIEELKAQGKPIPTELSVKLENISRNDYLFMLYKQISKLVITDDEVGTETVAEINELELNSLEVLVAYSDYEDKKDLFNIVKRLHYHDFSNIIADHNYVWSELELQNGKAIEVKPETFDIEPISEENKGQLDSLYRMDRKRINGTIKKQY